MKYNSKNYNINEGYITQKMDKKTTIFSPEKSVLFTLNEQGSYIFQGIKLGWKKEYIIQKLSSAYEITENDVTKDVDDFINLLIKNKIITEKI